MTLDGGVHRSHAGMAVYPCAYRRYYLGSGLLITKKDIKLGTKWDYGGSKGNWRVVVDEYDKNAWCKYMEILSL